MRLVTFNILHGRSPEDRRVDVDRFAEAVKALDADVLALQEVDRGQERSVGADLTAVAAEAMDATGHRFAAALAGGPGAWVAATGDEEPDAASYGVALLTRYPVQKWDVVRLPALPAGIPWSGRDPSKAVVVHDEPRVALLASIDTPTGTIAAASTHLSLLHGWNAVQLRLIVVALRRSKGPIVLMGDLNMAPDQAQRVSGLTSAVSAPTYPARSPQRQIDYFLCRGIAGPFRGGTREMGISDHRALVLEL